MQLSNDDWHVTKELVHVLEAMQLGTLLVEGEKQPSISIVLPMVFYILHFMDELDTGSQIQDFLNVQAMKM